MTEYAEVKIPNLSVAEIQLKGTQRKGAGARRTKGFESRTASQKSKHKPNEAKLRPLSRSLQRAMGIKSNRQ